MTNLTDRNTNFSDNETPRKLSELVQETIEALPSDKERIPFSWLNEQFHERGFGLFLFFYALPMALPVPVPPGINLILATPLIFLTAQQAMMFHKPWFPEFIRKRDLKVVHLQTIFSKIIPLLKKLEFLIKPRLSFMTKGVMSRLIGVSGLIMALTVSIPFPMTNTVPSFGIALMSAGVLMRDGLAVIVGMLIGLAWVTMLVLLGQAGLEALIGLIRGG